MRGIKRLLKIPIIIYPYGEISDTGDETYESPKDSTCYGEGKMKVITDKTGSESVSEITLYIDGAETLTDQDEILYDDARHHIKSLSKIKELNGDIALWVVYL